MNEERKKKLKKYIKENKQVLNLCKKAINTLDECPEKEIEQLRIKSAEEVLTLFENLLDENEKLKEKINVLEELLEE